MWGALATWQDSSGTQWVIVPFWGPVSRDFQAPIENGKRPEQGGVAALKLEHREQLEPCAGMALSGYRDSSSPKKAIAEHERCCLHVRQAGKKIQTQQRPERA